MNQFVKLLKHMLKVEINDKFKSSAFYVWYFKHAQRLLGYKDKHKGQDCFIIGNGPSLNSMDLKPLKNYHTFGLNKIYLLFDKVDLNLSYHVSVNKLVIEQSIEEFKKLTCPSFLSYSVSRKLITPFDHIHFIYTGAPMSFVHDLTQKICEGHTVTYVAMQIAYFMGFKRVFLIGIDHNFTAAGKPNEKQFMNNADYNHFDPNYFGNKCWNLPDLEASELAYRLAGFHYKRSGRQIINATENGKLTIFPKMSYDQALNTCKLDPHVA